MAIGYTRLARSKFFTQRHFLILLSLSLSACQSSQLTRSDASDLPLQRNVPRQELDTVFALYPTGRFNPDWVTKAERADRKMRSAKPEGEPALYEKSNAKNAALNPNGFTYLGPDLIRSGANFYTGRVSDFVLSPQPLVAGDNTSYRVLAATSGGIWRSDNCCFAGTTWRAATEDPSIRSSSIGDLAVDPNNPNVIYAGTGDLRFGTYMYSSDGILKTTDGGSTWRKLGADVFAPSYPVELSNYPQRQAIGKIVVDPNDSNKVVVGTKTGLYFSSDAGEHFTGPCYTNAFTPPQANRQRQDVTGLLAINRNGATELIAAIGTRGNATPVQPDLDLNGANGIYRAVMPATGCPVEWQLVSRADNGWPQGTGNGNGFGPLGRIELAEAPSNANVLYAMVAQPQSFEVLGIWGSNDFGNTWTRRDARVSNAGANGDNGCELGDQNWYNFGLSVAPNNANQLVLSNWWVGLSNDQGANVVSVGCVNGDAPYHIDQHARAFVGNDPNKLLIGNDGGVYFSDNFQSAAPTFTSIAQGLGAVEFYGGDIGPNFATSELRTVVGGAQDNGTSVQQQFNAAQSSSWLKVFGGDGITARIEPILGQRHYYSTQTGRIYLSNNGANAPEANAHGIWATTLDSTESKLFLTQFDLYRYGNVDEAGSGCSRTSGCTHLIYGSTRVWESTTGAVEATAEARWQAISDNLTKNTLILDTDVRSVISTLAFSFQSNKTAIVGTMDGNAWYGFDLGQRPARSATWVNVTDNNRVLPNRTITKVTTDPNNALIGYATLHGFDANTPSTPGHVYQIRCSERCATFSWRNVSGNLPDVPAQSVLVNPWNSKQVFVGTEWGLYFTNNVEAAFPIWNRFIGFPRVSVWDMQVDRGFTTIIAFTRARGAWVWPLPRLASDINLSGIWANYNELGWGMTITHQSNTLFPIWYTYDNAGRPAWLMVSGAPKQNDGSYLGRLVRVTGTPFQNINNATAFSTVNDVGEARFTLQADESLRMDYSVDGISQSKTMQRFIINPMPSCQFTSQSRVSATNFSDIWWNAAESGWGLQLLQADATIFATWYSYRDDGSAMWATALLSRQSDGRFVGDINRPTSGVPLPQINGPATSFPVPTVGSASLQFTAGDRGSFTYTLDGVTQTKAIERYVFAPNPLTVCE